MTPVEMIALVLIALILVKLVVFSINPGSWKSVVKKIYANPPVTVAAALILGAVVLNYLLKEMTIVQIFAAMAFMIALMMVQFAALGGELMDVADRFLKDRSIVKKLWLSLSIWVVLIFWVLYEIFV